MQRYTIQANPDDKYRTRPYAIFDSVRDRNIEDFRSLEDAQDRMGRIEWEDTLPVGIRSSYLLVNVRAVRSKAQTTIDDFTWGGKRKLTTEEQEQIDDLEAAVKLLNKWQRTGKTPKYPGSI